MQVELALASRTKGAQPGGSRERERRLDGPSCSGADLWGDTPAGRTGSSLRAEAPFLAPRITLDIQRGATTNGHEVNTSLGNVAADPPDDAEDDIDDVDPSSLEDFLQAVAFVPTLTPPRNERARDGEKIGRFQITGSLGHGGMGVVYAAIDLTLKRKVALKLLPGSAAQSEEQRGRILREARAGAAVIHQNIAAVFDVGEVDGVVFIAMECVEGSSLRSLISARGTALPEAEAVTIAREIACGLAAAHEAGVTHRDIKPENVMISDKGRVKLVDFGLAKLGEAKGASLLESIEITTQEGRILGTPSYMSPEQARGLAADARSDIFSFGVVLFEMLVHARPFSGATTTDILAAITRDAPPPLDVLRDGARGPLARVVSRCLEKDPARRYAHAGELLTALDGAATDSRAALAARSWKRWGLLLAAPVAVTLGVVVHSSRDATLDQAIPAGGAPRSVSAAPPIATAATPPGPTAEPTSASSSLPTRPRPPPVNARPRPAQPIQTASASPPSTVPLPVPAAIDPPPAHRRAQ